MASALTQLSLASAHAGLLRKEFSSHELTQAHLDRLHQLEPKLHAFLTVTADRALQQAAAVDKIGNFSHPLTGVPAALKDNMCVNGIRATAASKILETYVATYDATVAERLAARGMVLLGKTNLDEFACGSSTEYSAYGSTHNPWDVSRVPGGSSGGSAAAVAAGEACYALGSDTGGSIRQPASLCGVVGVKPTYGRVSRYGLIAMASSLDQIGPFTRSVADAALVLQAIAGQDRHDATTTPHPVPDYTTGLAESVAGLRVGVPKEYFSETTAGLEPGVKQAFEAMLKTLERLGVEVVTDISLPHTDYALAVYYILCPAELSSNLARFDGIKYGLSKRGAKTLVEEYGDTRREGFGAEIRRRVMLGTYVLSAGYYDAYYKKAQQVRTLVCRDFTQAFEQVDFLVTPTTPTVAFKTGARMADPLSMYLSDIYTVAANVAGVPGLSLPVGMSEPPEGGPKLPVGLQLIGKPFDEATILRVARQIEQAVNFSYTQAAATAT